MADYFHVVLDGISIPMGQSWGSLDSAIHEVKIHLPDARVLNISEHVWIVFRNDEHAREWLDYIQVASSEELLNVPDDMQSAGSICKIGLDS